MTRDAPPLVSVIVFVRGAGTGVGDALASLRRQSRFDAIEAIVADGTPEGRLDVIARDFPWARHLWLPGETMPVLKGKAIAEARGAIVAILDPNDVAAPDWAAEILDAFKDEDLAAVGGSVEAGGAATAANCAAYLFEYGAFTPPLPAGPTGDELPGNNLAHRRDLLIAACQPVLAAEGFNKPFCHQRLRAQGGRFVMRPSMRVRHVTHYRFLAFARRRFHYGRCFGAKRLGFCTRRQRILYRLLAPGVPFLLMGRHLLRAWRHPVNRLMVARAGLALMGICLFWGVGEWLGYWRGAGRSCAKLW
ncbi:MAG: glycosyltransferase [Pseudomonadota bacterium]